MIVKDEEEMLPRCLAAVRDAVDELVIVDTGSKDRTREIALEFGAKVIDFEWTGSFSDARNVSFDAATGDWLMFLDADEVLVEGDGERLRALTGQTWREAHYLLETNHTGTLEDGTAVTHNALRVFRNRPGLRFEGRIHEQIAQHLPAFLPERLAVSDVRIDHYGYLGAVRDAKEKSRRNIELLERQVAEGLDSPFLAFNLGSEYAAAGDTAAALEKFESAWARVRDDQHIATYGFVPSLAGRLVRALRVTGHLADARTRGDEVLRIFPGFTDVLLEQAIAAAHAGRPRRRDRRARALPGVGRRAEHVLRDEGQRHVPRDGDARRRQAHRRRPRRRGGAAAALPRRVPRLPGDDRAAHPPRCIARGAHAGGGRRGRRDRRRAAARPRASCSPPRSTRAARRRPPRSSSGACSRRSPTPRPRASRSARRSCRSRASRRPPRPRAPSTPTRPGRRPPRGPRCSACWPRRPPTTRSATAWPGPARPGCPRARPARWRRGSPRAPAPRPSRPASRPAARTLTLTMLEALLRLQAFELFAQLLPVVDALALTARDRHEQLARMYLRRGFLESAGDEWVAAIQENGPDVAALMGLSQVAAARGLDEDAELLAGEARALATA